MSVEFIRGPNVYLRETTAADLENIKEALTDWEAFPLSLDRTKNYLKGLLHTMRFIERPYTDTTHCREMFTVCKVSDNSFIGFTQYTVTPVKVAEIRVTASLPSVRGSGLMNEAALLRDAAMFTELGCTYYEAKLDIKYINTVRPYQTVEETKISTRTNHELRSVKAVKSDYDTWRAANSSSIPSYTFSGGSYTPPHLRA